MRVFREQGISREGGRGKKSAHTQKEKNKSQINKMNSVNKKPIALAAATEKNLRACQIMLAFH